MFDVPRQIFLHLERPDLEEGVEVDLSLVAFGREIRDILAERGRIPPFDLAVLSFLPFPEGCDCRLRAVHMARCELMVMVATEMHADNAL